MGKCKHREVRQRADVRKEWERHKSSTVVAVEERCSYEMVALWHLILKSEKILEIDGIEEAWIIPEHAYYSRKHSGAKSYGYSAFSLQHHPTTARTGDITLYSCIYNGKVLVWSRSIRYLITLNYFVLKRGISIPHGISAFSWGSSCRPTLVLLG